MLCHRKKKLQWKKTRFLANHQNQPTHTPRSHKSSQSSNNIIKQQQQSFVQNQRLSTKKKHHHHSLLSPPKKNPITTRKKKTTYRSMRPTNISIQASTAATNNSHHQQQQEHLIVPKAVKASVAPSPTHSIPYRIGMNSMFPTTPTRVTSPFAPQQKRLSMEASALMREQCFSPLHHSDNSMSSHHHHHHGNNNNNNSSHNTREDVELKAGFEIQNILFQMYAPKAPSHLCDLVPSTPSLTVTEEQRTKFFSGEDAHQHQHHQQQQQHHLRSMGVKTPPVMPHNHSNLNIKVKPQPMVLRVPTPMESVNYTAIHISTVDTPLPRPVALSPHPGVFDHAAMYRMFEQETTAMSHHQQDEEDDDEDDEDYDDEEEEEEDDENSYSGDSEYEEEDGENDDDDDGDVFEDDYQPFGFHQHSHVDEHESEYSQSWDIRSITPPLRSENPICSDDRFQYYSSTPVNLGSFRAGNNGVELGIFNFSPPIH